MNRLWNKTSSYFFYFIVYSWWKAVSEIRAFAHTKYLASYYTSEVLIYIHTHMYVQIYDMWIQEMYTLYINIYNVYISVGEIKNGSLMLSHSDGERNSPLIFTIFRVEWRNSAPHFSCHQNKVMQIACFKRESNHQPSYLLNDMLLRYDGYICKGNQHNLHMYVLVCIWASFNIDFIMN